MWRQSAVVLVVFRRSGLVNSEIRRTKLVGMGEELRWLCDLLKLNFGNLVYLLNFLYLALEFRPVGRAPGQIFAQLDII